MNPMTNSNSISFPAYPFSHSGDSTPAWTQGTGIFDYVKENIDAEGFFTKEILPDKPAATGELDFQSMLGSFDPYLMSDLSADSTQQREIRAENFSRQIHTVLQAFLEDPTPVHAADFYMKAATLPCILYYDTVIETLSQEPIPACLKDLTQEWLYKAVNREAVKLAIVITGLCLLNEDNLTLCWQLKKDLLLLARCEEFTCFVVYALKLSHQLENSDLWDLMTHTRGWGRLGAIEACEFNLIKERKWLLHNAFLQTIDYPAMALMVFNKLNIMDLLDHEHLQEDTFQDLTTLILHYLIYLTEEPEGPKANIDLWELLEAYLHHAEEHHTDLVTASGLTNLREYLKQWTENQYWDYLTSNQLHLLIGKIETLLLSTDWLPQIKAHLLDKDGNANLDTIHMGFALGLDLHKELWAILKKDPLQTELYGFLLDPKHKRMAGMAAKFASAHADLYLEQEEPCLPLLDTLQYFPGTCGDLVEKALVSIYDSCRSLALQVLEAWPESTWPKDAQLALQKARTMTTSPLQKLQIDVLLKKRTMEYQDFLDVIRESKNK